MEWMYVINSDGIMEPFTRYGDNLFDLLMGLIVPSTDLLDDNCSIIVYKDGHPFGNISFVDFDERLVLDEINNPFAWLLERKGNSFSLTRFINKCFRLEKEGV